MLLYPPPPTFGSVLGIFFSLMFGFLSYNFSEAYLRLCSSYGHSLSYSLELKDLFGTKFFLFSLSDGFSQSRSQFVLNY